MENMFDKKQTVDLVNHAIQLIGMGRYQWALFCLCGFGWMPQHSAFLSLALIAGLVCGATFWGLGSVLIGRRLAFNLTLLIASIFGIAAAAAPNFVTCAVLVSFVGFGVGGNLLSVWWAIGQIIPAGVAWGFLPNYSCSSETPAGDCIKPEIMGWIYLMYTMGGFTFLLWAGRFFLFHLHESPKYLIGQGRYVEVVEVLDAVAKYNRRTQPLAVEALEQVEINHRSSNITKALLPVNKKAAVKRAFAQFKPNGFPHIRSLFSTLKLAYGLILILLIWGMIGLASPLYSNSLPEYFAEHGARAGDDYINKTYRNNYIIIICSLLGTMVGGWLIGLKYIGRRGTLGYSLIVTAVFLFAFTIVRTEVANLAFNCVSTFTQYIMWCALYCYTPEVIPSLHRGTGTGLASAFNRICGLMAPIIATYVGSSDVPIYISAALYAVAGVLSLLLPFETMGKASL
ncbi:MFS general substrate transporter [Rhexocercosporidium sp. MPI-PUGE-AT-0058]|nr:MFS general substrate transporter [Rhexocercosporidium sp. MPI-PUGE-AT-0058]